MKLFSMYKYKTNNGKSISINIFNKYLIDISRIKNKHIQIDKISQKKYTHVMYLKINKNTDYSLKCLQHWINIAYHFNSDFYILCDNIKVKKSILKNIYFYNGNIKFLNSNRKRFLTRFVNKISDKYWYNATYAHLTTFLHAKKNKFYNFWNIDADDTTLLIDPQKVAYILNEAEIHAQKHNIDAFSFDMHTSRSNYQHWSWGITFIQNNIDWFKIFEKNFTKNWHKNYLKYDKNMNLDWYMTYLRDKNIINNKVFFIENIYFIHWGNFILNPFGATICKYTKNKIEYPILSYIFKNNYLGNIPISRNSTNIYTLSSDESLLFFNCFIKQRKEDLNESLKKFYCSHL